MKLAAKKKEKDALAKEEEESLATTKVANLKTKDNCKDSLTLQATINDLGMVKLRDKVLISKSTELTKEQRTRLS